MQQSTPENKAYKVHINFVIVISEVTHVLLSCKTLSCLTCIQNNIQCSTFILHTKITRVSNMYCFKFYSLLYNDNHVQDILSRQREKKFSDVRARAEKLQKGFEILELDLEEIQGKVDQYLAWLKKKEEQVLMITPDGYEVRHAHNNMLHINVSGTVDLTLFVFLQIMSCD